MTKKKLGPMNLYPLLPRTNCGQCSPKTCMGFAVQLCERNLILDQCPPLAEAAYAAQLAKLNELLSPPVREVFIGTGDHRIKIGGELVLRRHELRYFNRTAIATVIDDSMSDEELEKKVAETQQFRYPYIGNTLTLDAITVRSRVGSAEVYRECVGKVSGLTSMPLILWSEAPDVLEPALQAVHENRPLIYAANAKNWQKMGELALSYRSPLAIRSSGDVSEIRSIASNLKRSGIDDLVLDISCGFHEELPASISNLTMMRISAIAEDDELLGYPLIGSPVTLWDTRNSESDETIRWMESCIASMMMVRYTDLLLLRDATMWSILPLVVLRENLYNDPRKPVIVEPGLRVFGAPERDTAPVLITSNFALTYYTVLADIEKLNCYLLVADTEGLSIDSAVAGRKLNADKVADIIRSTGIEDRIAHRTLIIPGLAARLKGDIEDATKWDVLVGPRDSAGIPAFIREKWEGRDHTPGWSYR